MAARDARTGPDRADATPGRRREGAARDADRRSRGGGARPAAARRRPAPAPSGTGQGSVGEGVVVGAVPVLARLAGALLVLAGLVGLVAPFPTYLVVGGQALDQVSGVGGAVAALLVPITHLVVGAVLARGSVPKLGLAYAAVAGALAVGQLLIELYRGAASTTRPGTEVLAGELVLTSSIETGAGWLLGVLALGLTVLAGGVALAAWGRTVMEDAGTLDPVRTVLAGAASLLGVAAVLCLSLPAADVPDRIVTDPITGLQTVVTREGPQALLERPGLALLGGLLLAGAVVLCSVIAPSLRPRLAVVGGLLAITVVVLAAGLAGLRDAVASPDLDWTLPGVSLLVVGGAYVVLTVTAWRWRRARP